MQHYNNAIWSSWISRLLAILILRYSLSKKTSFVVSYCFSKPTFTHISRTECPILMEFSAKCSLCDVVLDYAEHSKLNVTALRLILLDHVTYSKTCITHKRKLRIDWKFGNKLILSISTELSLKVSITRNSCAPCEHTIVSLINLSASHKIWAKYVNVNSHQLNFDCYLCATKI